MVNYTPLLVGNTSLVELICLSWFVVDTNPEEAPSHPIFCFGFVLLFLYYRNGMDLTETEDIKKKWQEYIEKLYKKRSS